MSKKESEKKFVVREDFILISRPEDIEILKEAGFTEGSSHYWNGHIRSHTGSGLHMAGGQNSDHFRT